MDVACISWRIQIYSIKLCNFTLQSTSQDALADHCTAGLVQAVQAGWLFAALQIGGSGGRGAWPGLQSPSFMCSSGIYIPITQLVRLWMGLGKHCIRCRCDHFSEVSHKHRASFSFSWWSCFFVFFFNANSLFNKYIQSHMPEHFVCLSLTKLLLVKTKMR